MSNKNETGEKKLLILKSFVLPDFDEITSNFDKYVTKKTYISSIFNIVLITTNLQEIKTILAPNDDKNVNWSSVFTFYNIILLLLIFISLTLQLLVSVILIKLARQVIKINNKNEREDEFKSVRKYNSIVTILLILISIINIFLNVIILEN
jgi:hypothetical protein